MSNMPGRNNIDRLNEFEPDHRVELCQLIKNWRTLSPKDPQWNPEAIDENHTPLTDEQLKFMIQILLPILNYAEFYPTFYDVVNHLDTYSQQDILDGRSFFTDMNAFINWPDWFDDSMIRENFDQEFERTFAQEIPQWDQTIRDNFVNMFGPEVLL